MTLLEYSNQSKIYWQLGYDFQQFFKTHPKFEDAVIVREDEIDYNFDCDYRYYYCWLVELSGKMYNLLLSEGGRYRRAERGFKFKRYYPDGVKPKKQRKYDCDFTSIRTQSIVPIASFSNAYRNDCQIWTLAKCFDISYEEAYSILSTNGWRENNTKLSCFVKSAKNLCNSFERYFFKFSNNNPFKGSIVGNINKKLPKVGKFAVCSNDHIFCVIDGVIYDSAFSPKKHVESVYEIK